MPSNPRSPAPARSNAWRKARATILWSIGGLLLVQLALRLVIDGPCPELRDPTFEIKFDRLTEARRQYADPPRTIIMTGSSVTNNIFNCKLVEQGLSPELDKSVFAFNMGCQGAGPLTELVWMHRLLDRGFRPDVAIVEVSPHMYNCEVPADAGRLPGELLTESDMQTMAGLVPERKLRKHWSKYRWLPAYAHRLTILNYAAHVLVPTVDQMATWGGLIDDRCWTPLPAHTPEERAPIVATMKSNYEKNMACFSPGATSLQAFTRLLELLKRNDVQAMVVVVPQGPAIRGAYPKDALERFMTRIAELSKENSATFVSAFDWLDEDQFNDCLHPTTEGAAIFSERLTREVLIPALVRSEGMASGGR